MTKVNRDNVICPFWSATLTSQLPQKQDFTATRLKLNRAKMQLWVSRFECYHGLFLLTICCLSVVYNECGTWGRAVFRRKFDKRMKNLLVSSHHKLVEEKCEGWFTVPIGIRLKENWQRIQTLWHFHSYSPRNFNLQHAICNHQTNIYKCNKLPSNHSLS